MEVKLLEVRDDGTFIPMLCVNMNPGSLYPRGSFSEAELKVALLQNANRLYLLRRSGYPCDGRPNIAITPLGADGDRCSNDPFFWGDRTRATAHKYIIAHWNELTDGDVIDVEYILGERKEKKRSERETAPL